MNKILILIGAILGIMLVVVNLAASAGTAFTVFGRSEVWELSINSVISGVILGYGLKGYLSEKSNNNKYEDDENGFNF